MEGRWPHQNSIDGYSTAIANLAAAAQDGVTQRYIDEPIDRCYETVLAAFHGLCVYTGYVAAEMVATGPEAGPDVTPYQFQRFLGSPWLAVLETLEAFPDAREPISRTVIDNMTWTTRPLLQRWLTHIGFSVKDTGPGETYFDVLRTDF